MNSSNWRYLTIPFLLTAILLACLPSLATTYYVRQTGNDQADGLTPATAYKTVLSAVQSLNHGDMIIIGPGSYTSSALIADRFGTANVRLTILGDESGQRTGDAPGPVIIQALKSSDNALEFSRVSHLTISGLTFQGAGQGVKLVKCQDAIIERCTFSQQTRGLVTEGVQGLQVESTIFSRCTIGIFLHNTQNSRLAHNTIAASSSTGVVLLACGTGAIRNSLFAANNANYVADIISAPAWSSDYNVIHGPTGPWGDVPSAFNISEWFPASGQERHSIYLTPSFRAAEKYDLHIAPQVSWGGGLPGMTIGAALTPKVNLDRDARPFRNASAGAYDYPDPVPANEWNQLQVMAPGAGPRQSAGIYRLDGTLVRMLLADVAGVRNLWWNGLDDNGQPVEAAPLQVRSITHDTQLLDDGSIGDNGNPQGAYNCDNADRALALPDGSFLVTTVYDEAGYVLRRYSSSGQPTFAANLTDSAFWGIALSGNDIIGGAGKGKEIKLIRLALPGTRIKMANGADDYPLLTPGENSTSLGLAVVGEKAYIALDTINVVRVIDLATGKKIADWPVPEIGDIASDAKGTIWVLSGKEILSLADNGQVQKHYATGLLTPRYLAVSPTRLAAIDRKAAKIALLNVTDGKIIRTIGKDRTKELWMPVSTEAFSDPRGAAFLPDGKLLLTEHARVRAFWPETGKEAFAAMSNFMETAVTHPTKPEYVYCGLGIFHVDPKTNAWQWLVETPTMNYAFTKEEDPWNGKRIGSPGQSVILAGRPFIAYYGTAELDMFDVSDPLKPRLALEYRGKAFNPWAYATICFSKDGDIIAGGNYTLAFKRYKFTGLDAQNNPLFDFDAPTAIGIAKDPETTRGMKSIEALTSDRSTGDIYYLAVSASHNKMVPAWGADGTGVGKTTPDGAAKWFSLSSGGNYMSISSARDAKQSWILAAKSFGGQIDVFDEDGLRVTTGNWSWPSAYQMGFVDMRYGVHAYLREDGKVGAYVEDDAVGRFTRVRLDGAETIQRTTTPFNWGGAKLGAGAAPAVNSTVGGALATQLTIQKVPELPVNGDWDLWEKNGVTPQIIALPSNVGFKRFIPDDLMSTFRQGTYLGALAHDDKNIYVYFVATDDTPHFNATQTGVMWMFDSFELWLEEEQFGLGFLENGTPGIHKYRFHDKAGKEWSSYQLPKENIWGLQIADLSTHPLGQRLADIIGTSLAGKGGFAVMAKIPYEDIKLVGGPGSGRGEGVASMTGEPGEIVRVAVSLNKILEWGRVQDYMIDWPTGKMFSDPSRSYPFVLGK